MINKLINDITDYVINKNCRIDKYLFDSFPENIKSGIQKLSQSDLTVNVENIDLFNSYLRKINGAKEKFTHLEINITYLLMQCAISIDSIKEKSYFDYKNNRNYPLFKYIPELHDILDKDDLIEINSSNIYYNAILFDKFLFGFDEKINYDLKKFLISFTNCDNTIKIKPSLFDINLKEKFLHPLQKAYFWGKVPKPDEIIKNINQKQLQVHERCIMPGTEHLYTSFIPAKRFEVSRTIKKDNKVSYLAELLPESSEKLENVKTYILHSDMDFGSKFFSHIDVSLLIYSRDSYNLRINKNINDIVKADYHIKLFKIENQFSISDWAQLLYLVFPRNELIHEYITGEDFSEEIYYQMFI